MSDRKTSRFLTAGMAAALLLAAGLQSSPAQACGSTQPLIATMCVFAGNFAPRSYAFTNGQILSISTNTALFSILGTTYGGDGRTTFGLPDTRGRSVIGEGQGPGLQDYRLGLRGGVETVTLSIQQMPSHSHSATTTAHANSAAGNEEDPTGNVWARKGRTNVYSDQPPNVTMNAVTTSVANTGGSQGHENRPPYIAMNWIIALTGTFPSRN